MAIQKQLRDERAQVEKARVAAQDQRLLTTETAGALKAARDLNDRIVNDLANLGRQALDEPASWPWRNELLTLPRVS